MKTTKEITCIGCPMGCSITAVIENEVVAHVEGYSCNRGKIYAEKECVAPSRIVTTTLTVVGGESPTVSVKTAADIPKGRIFDCIRALRDVRIQAPVKEGDILAADIAGTGVDVIATSSVKKAPLAS